MDLRVERPNSCAVLLIKLLKPRELDHPADYLIRCGPRQRAGSQAAWRVLRDIVVFVPGILTAGRL